MSGFNYDNFPDAWEESQAIKEYFAFAVSNDRATTLRPPPLLEKPISVETSRPFNRDVLREAVQRELNQRFNRGTNARGHDLSTFIRLGKRHGETASNLSSIQPEIKYLKQSEAIVYIHSFVEAYSGRRKITDRDIIADWGLVQYKEYKRLKRRRRESIVLAIAQRIRNDPLERESVIKQARRSREIEDLTRETGMSSEYVKAYLVAYDKELAMRQLPRDIVQISERRLWAYRPHMGFAAQITKSLLPLLPLIVFLKDLIPGTGLIEGITGEDLITGRRLGVLDRSIGAVFDLIPLARKALKAGIVVGRSVVALSESALRSAKSLAIVALRLNLEPTDFLRMLARTGKLSIKRVEELQKRLRIALLNKKRFKLSVQEQQTIENVRQALEPITSARTGLRFSLYTLPQAAQQLIRNKGLTNIYEKYGSKLAHDNGTINELAGLISKTKSQGFMFQTSRAAAGEFVVLHQLHKNRNVRQIRLVPTSNVRGARTPDFTLDFVDGTQRIHSLEVEVTTVSLARKGQRQPNRGVDISSTERGIRARGHNTRRPFKTSKVASAIKRKIKRGQVNDGIIAVFIPNKNPITEILTRRQLNSIHTALLSRPNIREVWVVYHSQSGRIIKRIDNNLGSLGIAVR